eukprot:1123872-Rhodomonas_salina.1
MERESTNLSWETRFTSSLREREREREEKRREERERRERVKEERERERDIPDRNTETDRQTDRPTKDVSMHIQE